MDEEAFHDDVMTSFISRSADQTRSIAEKWGVELKRNRNQPLLIFLQGDLGAGKTTFVQGLAQGLGCSVEEVTSPTFTLIHEYPFPIVSENKQNEEARLIHADLYRIESEQDFMSLGLEDYFRPNTLVVIEWPEKMGTRKWKADFTITLEWVSENERKIRFSE